MKPTNHATKSGSSGQHRHNKAIRNQPGVLTPELFDKHGGFRRLHSFTLATIVQLDTLRFCRRFITQDPRESGGKFYDPRGGNTTR